MPAPLFSSFDYSVPDGMVVPVPGARVRADFSGRSLVGVCTDADPPHAHERLKPLTEVLDDHNCLGQEVFDLATWLSEYYHHPLGEVLHTILPTSAARGADLDVQPETWWRTAVEEARLERAPRQRALFDHLGRVGPRTAAEIRAAGFTTAMLDALVGKGLVEAGDPEPVLDNPPTLTAEQVSAVEALGEPSQGFSATLIEGVTGSGKTEVYLRHIARVLASGRQVMVLVPEIALTPQTLTRFKRRFGRTHVLHSNLADGERLQTWLKCRSGEARILVGTRSAVLTPFEDLGLIVVDEEHDGSFKQTEGLRYSARDAAVKRAHALGIPLILGSATPSLESLLNARRGRYRHVHLFTRATGAPLPSLHVLDTRGHSTRDGISNPLVHIIRRHIDAGGQVLVFLNRRGFAPTCLCTACGWQALCPRCDARLTMHRTPAGLICHHCGIRQPLPAQCPECENEAALKAVGVGTQRTEQGLIELFPGTPVYRIDRDSVRSQQRLEDHLAQIHTGEPAILIGTQLLAKGHDFSNVTLVATVNADAGFLSADFRAPERTAQLIIQVAGRAGRAGKPGEVWIQSMQPDNPVLTSLIETDYAGFAAVELDVREAAGLPPFRPMALLRAESESSAAAAGFLQTLKQRVSGAEVYGPAPAPITRVANRHRHQLMLLADDRGPLHSAIRRLRGTAAPRGVRWAIDVDPYDTF
jgi:primosomal protein N' (replication factor Y)|tara:strand:+ start:1528 stop:3627 length:2100 start_codon:yes stop_codon:yes gene_type:complete